MFSTTLIKIPEQTTYEDTNVYRIEDILNLYNELNEHYKKELLTRFNFPTEYCLHTTLLGELGFVYPKYTRLLTRFFKDLLSQQ